MDVARTVRRAVAALFLLHAASAFAALIDINQASADTLAAGLPGIGAVKAAAIVEWRTQNGPFMQVEDLLQVSGIGPGTLARVRDLVTVGDALAQAATERERATVLAVRQLIERSKRRAQAQP